MLFTAIMKNVLTANDAQISRSSNSTKRNYSSKKYKGEFRQTMICNTICASIKKSNKTKTQEHDSANDNDYKTNIGNSISSILQEFDMLKILRFKEHKNNSLLLLV